MSCESVGGTFGRTAAPPNRTTGNEDAVKFVPCTVTNVPAEPLDGATPVTVGGNGTYVNSDALTFADRPMSVWTRMNTVVSGDPGGLTAVTVSPETVKENAALS